jgi:hypothetical protein
MKEVVLPCITMMFAFAISILLLSDVIYVLEELVHACWIMLILYVVSLIFLIRYSYNIPVPEHTPRNRQR